MKFAKWSLKKALTVWTMGLLMATQAQMLPAFADDDGTFQTGVRLYNSGRYASALNYFVAAEREASYDPRIPYYEGLCHHKLGHISAARASYQKVVDKYPDSDAAELAKQGLGTIDYGSGYDRSGGSLAKLDKLRMDVVPLEVTLQCQELGGKPIVEVSVDGKKIPFLVDPTTASTSIGLDLVRSNNLNDVSLSAKPKTAKVTKTVKEVKEVKTSTDNKAPSDKDNKAAADKDVKPADEIKTSKDSQTTVDAGGAAGGKDASSQKDATTSAAANADNKSETKVETKSETKTETETKAEIKAEAKSESKSAAATPAKPTNDDGPAVNDATVILYDLNLGPIQRPGFPVLISTAKPKQAVLGRDFLGPYKLTFNASAKTLSMVRDRYYDNPFAAGMALFNKGKYAQAVPLLKRAAENRASDPRPLYCYASALQRSGNTEAAKMVYRQVNQRFPNSEANFYAMAAQSAIDPSYMREIKAARQQDTKTSLTTGRKNTPYFDLPYTIEGGSWVKVMCTIDSRRVEVYLELHSNDLKMSTAQLNAIDPSYVNDLQEVSTVTDFSTNYMWTVVTKKGFLKRVALGEAEKYHVPLTVVDQGGLKFQAAWTDQIARPLIPINLFNDWTYVFKDDLKVIRFFKQLPNASQR